MSAWSYDPAAYKIGDPLYIASGYSNETVTTYTVERITPKGQVVACSGAREIRVTAHGSIIGNGRWDRERIVSADKAAEIGQEQTTRKAWYDVRVAAEEVANAARRQDDELAVAKMAVLTTALSRARGDA